MGAIKNKYGTSPIGGGGGGGGGNNNNNDRDREQLQRQRERDREQADREQERQQSQNKYATSPVTTMPIPGGGGKGGGGGLGGGTTGMGGGNAGPGPITPTSPWGGTSGAGEANTRPEDFIKDVLSRAGVIDYSDPDYADWATNTLVKKLLTEYQVAKGANQTLNITDWMRNTYGASFGSPDEPGEKRKHGHGLKPGTPGTPEAIGNLSMTTGDLPEGYQDYISNKDPYAYFSGEGGKQGIYGGGGGGAEFQQYFQGEFADSVLAQWRSEKAGNPTLSLHDYLKGRDLASEARAGFSAYQSNKDPMGYLMGQMMSSGGSMDAEFQEFFRNSYGPMIIGAFNAARASNPNLSMADFMAGQGASMMAGAQAAFGHFKSNTDPVGYLMGQGSKSGAILPTGGNPDFADYYRTNTVPRVQSQWQGIRSGNTDFNLDDFVSGRNLLGQTQMNYLFRPMATRAPGPVNLSGRYSWWG